jgi:hypothetical protein
MKLEFSWQNFEKYWKNQISWKFVEWEPSCFHADRRSDGQTVRHDEGDSRFFAILLMRLKTQPPTEVLISDKPFHTESKVYATVWHIITKVTNKMQLYRLIYYSYSAVHVSGEVFAHHQEHLTVFTESGNIHSSRCRLVSWMCCTVLML